VKLPELCAAATIATLCASSAVAAAQPVPAPPPPPPSTASQAAKVVPAPRRARRKVEHKEPETTTPAPDVRLTLEAPTARGAWTMRVTNAGEVPVRLVGDARLLSLDVTPRGEARPVRCELPADMGLKDDMVSAVVLPPGRSYVESFQPVLYCLGGRALAALTQGSIVVGHLGWMGKGAKPPFEVAPIDGVEPVVAPLRKLDAPPIAVPDDPTPPEATSAHVRADDPDRVKLVLTGQTAVDVGSPSHLFVTVTLRNAGTRPVTVRFRPETLRFRVTAPAGPERCKWPVPPVAAMPDLFTTLRPGASESQTVLLGAYCGGHSLDHPGLLVVASELDTRKGSGAEIALSTFDGDIVSSSPTYVRLHEGIKPSPMRRPKLEPLVGAPAPAASGMAGTPPAATAPIAPAP
jgi:hypothetical protein